MKTFILLTVVSCLVVTLNSQTLLKPKSLQHLFYSGDSINFNNTTIWSSKKQTKFMLGWQWAGPNKATNERLHINFQEQWFNADSYWNMFANFSDTDTSNVVWGSLNYPGAVYGLPLHAVGFQYNPTALQSISYQQPNNK